MMKTTTREEMRRLGREVEAIAKERNLSQYRMRMYIGGKDGVGPAGGAVLHSILGHTENGYTMAKFLNLLNGMGKTIVIVDEKDLGASNK